jgi:hypothetical protein
MTYSCEVVKTQKEDKDTWPHDQGVSCGDLDILSYPLTPVKGFGERVFGGSEIHYATCGEIHRPLLAHK